MKCYLLGLDAGTTAFKAALFDDQKNQIAVARHDYTLSTPATDIVEFPADAYWDILCKLIRELLEKAQIDEMDIRGLALSSQGETLICLDESNRPLGSAIVWLDNRATVQAEALRSQFGREQVYTITGQADMLATWPAAKILWLRENRPDIFRLTKKYLLLEDYLLFRLTGKWVGEANLWASSAMLNIHTSQWWPDMLQALDISPNQLPQILPCGTAIGALTSEAMQATGLSENTLISTGALDQTCNAIGCGLSTPGMICETTGSCLAVSAVLDAFVPYQPNVQITCQNHALPGRYTVLLWSQSAGMTLKWFAKNFYPECAELEQAFTQINRDAASIDMGCNGLTMLPHLTGAANPEYDSYARGVFCGATLEHGRAHFARAIMEAVACMLRRNLDQLESIGIHFDRIFSMGGGANSPIWLKIKADITHKRIRPLRADESACLGAAILAGVGAGVYESIDWTPDTLYKNTEIQPEEREFIAGDNLYCRYMDLYDSLKNYFSSHTLKE